MAPEIGTDLERAAAHLRAGELVAIPTETVYGLGANAFDAAACLTIFETKRRPAFDPLIVHVRSRAAALELCHDVPREAHALMERFWPGPLTLVLPKRAAIPDIVTSGLDTVALRQPAHPLTAKLLEALEFPLAAPSANLFGRTSPTTAAHVAEQLETGVAYILDGGACSVGVESTILGWEAGACVLYRPGGAPLEAIEELVGRVSPAQRRILPAAPGMLAAHYAPRTPLELGDLNALLAQHAHERVAVLAFERARPAFASRVLSRSGDLAEAARNLFAALRELDASGAERILAEPAPEQGLGRAINDRLRRAAAARTGS
ncbi:MAG: L-threonylcarbamoyladenylate synthase [Planctomycetota bacterium]|nr:L-threonylcarbamoyladenylate synthase [Planctomycetota bacterium]